MRIISGKYRGKKINPKGGIKARPTTDIAKEGLFNILVNRFEIKKVRVLDLFGGTGNISYEFASRGCPLIHIVEINNRNIGFIKKTIEELELKQIIPFRTNILTFIKTCSYKYDIVFADPPFNLKWIETIPEIILDSGILESEGIFILEHPGNKNFSHIKGLLEERKYGQVHFSIFENITS